MPRTVKILLACAALLVPVLIYSVRRHRQAQAAPTDEDVAAERLELFEAARRQAADFSKLATWDRVSGADPYVIKPVPHSKLVVGILRGANAVVVLDRSLRELERLPAPASPSALALAEDGTVFVTGELATHVARYEWRGESLVPSGEFEVGDVRAIRDIAVGPRGMLYVVEEHTGRLVLFEFAKRGGLLRRGQLKVGNGPIRLERAEGALVVDCLLDHALVIVKLDANGALAQDEPIRIAHDGPIWSFAVKPGRGGLLIAAGGVEDHPLDRTIGAFGYIDSFVYLYAVDLDRRVARREATINVSELGVVTPKALTLRTQPRVEVTVSGYGSDQLARLQWQDELSQPPDVTTTVFLPGTASVTELPEGALAFADPLLDAWILQAAEQPPRVMRAPDAAEHERDPLVRVGEALFFTTLMAPSNRSEGPLSRFTCETCHWEGYVDGRTHHTGRGDVHAVTKPLLGLFNNRPHFSRALDPDLTTVAFNEFRVAGAKSERDPWFSLAPSEAPWLSPLGWRDGTLSPEMLRKSLMSFLMRFNHRPNPMIVGRTRWSEQERAGAELFRDRCETCHEARLSGDVPASRLPFERWEEYVMASEGAIVWGKAEYKQTGIVPYVHERGARVPSLRRLYKKRPYFTNGSAPDIDDVLARARFLPSGFWHEAPQTERSPVPEAGTALDDRSRSALRSFLDLL